MRWRDSASRAFAVFHRGHTYHQIASILNEPGWIPLKGRQFTERNMRGLLARCDEKKLLTPRRFLLSLIERLQRQHEAEPPNAVFERPALTMLARLLTAAGYTTPRGHARWWPAQGQQLLDRRFDAYYRLGHAEASRG